MHALERPSETSSRGILGKLLSLSVPQLPLLRNGPTASRNMKRAEHGAWHLAGSLSIGTLSRLHLPAHGSADPAKEDPTREVSRGDARPRESTNPRPRPGVVRVWCTSWQEERRCQSTRLNTGLYSYIPMTLSLTCSVVAFLRVVLISATRL